MEQFFSLHTAKKSHISLMSHERSWSQDYFSSMNMALIPPRFHVIKTYILHYDICKKNYAPYYTCHCTRKFPHSYT